MHLTEYNILCPLITDTFQNHHNRTPNTTATTTKRITTTTYLLHRRRGPTQPCQSRRCRHSPLWPEIPRSGVPTGSSLRSRTMAAEVSTSGKPSPASRDLPPSESDRARRPRHGPVRTRQSQPSGEPSTTCASPAPTHLPVPVYNARGSVRHLATVYAPRPPLAVRHGQPPANSRPREDHHGCATVAEFPADRRPCRTAKPLFTRSVAADCSTRTSTSPSLRRDRSPDRRCVVDPALTVARAWSSRAGVGDHRKRTAQRRIGLSVSISCRPTAASAASVLEPARRMPKPSVSCHHRLEHLETSAYVD
ncbi:uncharacterized protein M6B38_413650 [Iris pallida]|uniref:Uncharacterized protein n=1 Tax=Iris pallida TaxID=29817 RepID=A0AAX6FKM5_IRIPA|nr:uncharacterized protein M6B38_413650 [Iris pallida]